MNEYNDLLQIAKQEYAKGLPEWWISPNKCPNEKWARSYMVMRKFKELVIIEHGENAWAEFVR